MSIIVVTGVPRSGTSMMMAMLEAGGIECVYEPLEDSQPVIKDLNPLGYFEHSTARHAEWSDKDLEEYDGKAIKVHGQLAHTREDMDVKTIIMRRNIRESVASIDNFRRVIGEPPRKNEKDFWQATIDAIRLWSANKPHIEIWYDDVLRNPANECQRILTFLYPKRDYGTTSPLDLQKMRAVVNRNLNHHTTYRPSPNEQHNNMTNL